MSKSIPENKLTKIISLPGLGVLGIMFVYWNFTTIGIPWRTRAAAFVSVVLSGIVFYHFVPSWLDFWSPDSLKEDVADDTAIPKGTMIKLFFVFLAVDAFYVLLVAVLQKLVWKEVNLGFWLNLDSIHYINIARDGYLPLTEDNWDRAVELVFLPGYSYALRIMNVVVQNLIVSGLITSALFFAASGCMFYRLLRLDHDHVHAMRTIKYLLLCPGVFFFAAPMSESMFFFFCTLCIYWVRKGKILPACTAAAISGFTRSLGVTLMVPVFFEIVHSLVSAKRSIPVRKTIAMILPVFIIPLGFAAYCAINYKVAGDPFQFMEYQSIHWGQRFGFFFASCGYQLERLLAAVGKRAPSEIGRWGPNFISCFFSLVLMGLAGKKLRPGYTAWFITYYFVAIGATALLSAPRYLMVCFPLLISIMLLTENRRADRVFTVLYASSALVYVYAWVEHWNVW